MDFLVLCFILLGLAQSLLLQLTGQYGTGLLIGALAVAAVQLGAIWALRQHYSAAAVKAISHLPARGSLVAWTTLCIAAAGVLVLVDSLLPAHESALQIFRPVAAHWAGWLVVALLVPIAEEIVFRAILIEWLRQKLQTPAAVCAAAATFGLLHGELRTGAFAFALGLVFGLAYVRTRSLAPSILAHVATNAVGLMLVVRSGGG
jgi:membrane protease YdiL (CAAX protease family)